MQKYKSREVGYTLQSIFFKLTLLLYYLLGKEA